MIQRPPISSPKSRAQKPARHWSLSPLQKQLLIGFIVLTVVVGLVLSVWYVTRIDSLQLSTVTATGGLTITPSLVERRVQETLEGSYLHLIPKRFSYLFPAEDIIASVESIPRVKSVQIEKVDRNALHVSFTEYVPFALWCTQDDTAGCVFIDNAGYAFDGAPQLSGGAFIRFLLDDDIPEVGLQPFASDYLTATIDFAEQLEADLGMITTTIHLRGDYDIDFSIAGGGVIKVSQHLPFEDTFSNLMTILSSTEFSDITPGSFQYIDLRFGDKVFVNEELPVIAVEPEPATEPDVSITATFEPVEDDAVIATTIIEESPEPDTESEIDAPEADEAEDESL
jgi:hypothetical protein